MSVDRDGATNGEGGVALHCSWGDREVVEESNRLTPSGAGTGCKDTSLRVVGHLTVFGHVNNKGILGDALTAHAVLGSSHRDLMTRETGLLQNLN